MKAKLLMRNKTLGISVLLVKFPDGKILVVTNSIDKLAKAFTADSLNGSMEEFLHVLSLMDTIHQYGIIETEDAEELANVLEMRDMLRELLG